MPLLDLLAPPACAGCRAPVPRAGPVLCPACARLMPWLRAGCPRCALPDHGGRPCPARAAAFSRAWAPLAYAGPAANMVRRLKFDGHLPLADAMAAAIAARLPAPFREVTLVGVPAQRARARRRGYDPAALLAVRLSARTGTLAVPCLRRVDRGRRHTGLDRRGRRDDRPEIEACGFVPTEVVLVDDVHTTGATLDACARALRAAGAARVMAVTYARTL